MIISTVMRVLTIALYSGFVAAQTLPGLPSCATTCLTAFEGGGTIAGCNQLDIGCICSNQNFLGSIACCLAAKCSVEDQQGATNYALSLCKANQVTNLPTAVSCTSTATSGSTGSAATVTSQSSTGTANGASATSSSNTPAASQTKNASPQITSGVGAGIIGGLAAAVVFL